MESNNLQQAAKKAESEKTHEDWLEAKRAIVEFERTRENRLKAKRAIVDAILEALEQKEKGNLTTRYAIEILKETIADLEANSLMRPVRSYLDRAES